MTDDTNADGAPVWSLVYRMMLAHNRMQGWVWNPTSSRPDDSGHEQVIACPGITPTGELVCPCQSDAENPAPHIASCPWSGLIAWRADLKVGMQRAALLSFTSPPPELMKVRAAIDAKIAEWDQEELRDGGPGALAKAAIDLAWHHVEDSGELGEFARTILRAHGELK